MVGSGPRRLQALPAPDLQTLLPALGKALDGTGPAVLPLPSDEAAAERLRVSLRPDDDEAPLEAEDIALVVATSGSTGAPKGALLTASAVMASATATHAALGGPGQWVLALPASSIGGAQVLVRSLLAGTRPVPVDNSARFSAKAFATATSQLTGSRRYTALVPTQLVRLLEEPAGVEALGAYDAVLLGGAAANPRSLDDAARAGIRIVTTYGMTETSGGCVYNGVPLDGVDIRLGDGGRISIGGPTLFCGYRLQPELTASSICDGRFRTADLGEWWTGRLEVLGRVDDVVVTGGVNVSLSAVSFAIAAHSDIADAAAVGVPDEEWGARVIAVVSLWEGADGARDVLLAELRRLVTARLGREAAPREVVLVDSLPRLSSGKLDRLALRTLAEESVH